MKYFEQVEQEKKFQQQKLPKIKQEILKEDKIEIQNEMKRAWN